MIAIRMIMRKLGADARGATAIEYGLIAALIAIACIGAFMNLGGGSEGKWGNLADRVEEVM